MKPPPYLTFVIFGLVLILSVDIGASKSTQRGLTEEDPSRLHRSKTRPKILFRVHRQAEDSYEEGNEYEYEEEESPIRANEPEPEEQEQKSTKEPEGEDYYEGETYDERNEDEAPTERTEPRTTIATTTTTTTTTTPEPPEENVDDDDRYEERYEEERRRYEQETLRQQYEQTHGSDNESVEESQEERSREPEETTEPEETQEMEESTVEDVQTSSPETTTDTITEDEDPEETSPRVEQEVTPKTEDEVPGRDPDEGEESMEKEELDEDVPKRNEDDVSYTSLEPVSEVEEPPLEEDNETLTVDKQVETVQNPVEQPQNPDYPVEEPPSSVEINESGRDDLERYSTPTRGSDKVQDLPEDLEEEYNEVEEEEEPEVVAPTTSPTTTTTSTTPKPIDKVEEPYEYEVEESTKDETNGDNEEEDDYYDREPEVTSPPVVYTTTAPSTTTTMTPMRSTYPPSSIENEVESVEDFEGGRRKPYQVDRIEEPEVEDMNNVGEVDNVTVDVVEDRITSTKPPLRPLPEEYESEEEDEDLEGPYLLPEISSTMPTTTQPTTTTTTTAAPTTTPTRRPAVVISTRFPPSRFDGVDSSENDISSEESLEEVPIDQRNQYEVSPTFRPETSGERVQDVVPKIECFTGYRLSEDGEECLDDDECSRGICGPTQTCLNLPGSYKCSCPSGYIVDFRNEKNCRDLNECEDGNGGCHQDCINTPGSFYCACADDYDLGVDGKLCTLKPTTTTTTTTTTSTTPRPPATTSTPEIYNRIPGIPKKPEDPVGVKNCPTPPVPRGSGIAYLYCSRSPVGIHHRHSQLERRLLQDWAAKRNRTQQGGRNNNLRFRNRRNLLKRKLRQTTYSPGSMCELRCRPGFELKGQYTLHCNASGGTWHGTRSGLCQALPKTDNQNLPIGVSNSEATPNEIPRLAPNEISGFNQFRPSFVSLPTTTSTYRPTYFYQPLPPVPTSPFKPPFRPLPPQTTPSTTTTTTTSTTTSIPTTTTTPKPVVYWPKPASGSQVPSRRPYYFSPSTPYSNNYNKPLTTMYVPVTTTTIPTTTTSRNSYIHLTYRFKTPWITCPDDIKLDLPTNQNTAYVIIPQPQTNVDWWRQVTAEPAWAKGLETEMGPGKQRVTFRARTSAPVNNSAECSFTLDVRDNDPPRVRECPESFSTRLNSGQQSKPVTWIEPTFSDNVRITSLKKSHEPGAMLPFGEHLINYEAKDSSDNKARCSFTVNVLPPGSSHQQNVNRKPVNTEGATTPANISPKPELHASLRNVVCHVGKKGRRIVFQSRVVPRGCSEMTVDVAGDAAGREGSVNTLNTITQNSAENSATSQISSVSFSSHDHPQQASAFSQAVSNGRNNNRLVHSTSSVTNGAHGTSSKASSYAVSISSSSRNFDLPFLTPDKQVYEEDFVVPQQPEPKTRSGQTREGSTRESFTREGPTSDRSSRGGYIRESQIREGGSSTRVQSNKNEPFRKYFRHFDTWDTTTDASSSRSRESIY